MSVTITGLDDLNVALSGLVVDIDKAVDDVVLVTAKLVKNTARLKLGNVSQGDDVVRYSPRREHTVSKKGDAPNTDTRKLERSIKVTHTKGSKVSHVSTDVDYGFFLETVHDRPWLEPSKVEESKNFGALMEKAIKKQLSDI